MSSQRRFFCRPSSVLLLAMGSVAAKPAALQCWTGKPPVFGSMRYTRTSRARMSERPQLSWNGPPLRATLSVWPQPSLPEPQTPRSSGRDVKDPSPLAQSVAPPAPLASQEHTLTSASASLVLLPGFSPSHAEVVARDVFARIDIRVGRIVSAASVTISEALLDLAVDVGDQGGLRRVVQNLGLSFAPEDLVGKRVLVVCNLEPSLVAEGLVSHGLVLAAGPPERLALATVVEDVQPGHAVR